MFLFSLYRTWRSASRSGLGKSRPVCWNWNLQAGWRKIATVGSEFRETGPTHYRKIFGSFALKSNLHTVR